MDRDVLMEIEKLRRASLDALRTKYKEVFGEGTQCRHREHLFRRIGLAAAGVGNRRSFAKGTPACSPDCQGCRPKDHRATGLLCRWR
jgi:hypothetical protein